MLKQMKKMLALTLVIVTALTGLTGCGKKGSDIEIGTWKDNVFENNWLNMKFQLPDKWNIATDEEISEIMGSGLDYMELKGSSKKLVEAAAKVKTIYGFMISEPSNTANVQLLYENLALSVGGTKYDEAKYFDAVMKSLPDNMGYKVEEESQVEIAGKTFEHRKLSAMEGTIYMDYYLYKVGKYMVSLVISYQPGQEDVSKDFVKNISTIK